VAVLDDRELAWIVANPAGRRVALVIATYLEVVIAGCLP
jgi:hypothetical protein